MHLPHLTLRRRAWLLLALAGVAGPAAAAEPYPAKPIEWVVPYPAGGGTDVVARTLAEAMGKALGQPIIINNKPGAATNIGAEYVAHAKADGYVLLSADTATLAVNPQVPVKTLAEFKAWAKTQNGANYATPGAGSPHHLATELFRAQAGLQLTHVPYRGAAPAVQDVVAGQVPFMLVDTASGYQFIAAGKLRPIGVASPRRVPNFETIPTLQEQGLKGFEAYAWQGLVAPAGTPPEVIAKLNAALLGALGSTAIKARLQTLGLESIPGTPRQMADYAAAERAKWSQVIQASGIKLD